MKNKKLKLPVVFLLGIMVGMALTGVVAAQSGIQVMAYLDNNIQMVFNGETKTLPADMDVIIYNDRTYTPARFVAEELGAEVGWDEVTRSVLITWDEPVVPEPVDPEPVPDVDEEIEALTGTFDELPITKVTSDAFVSITGVDIRDNDTWIYMNVEGRKDQPIYVDQRAAKLTVEGASYLQADVRAVIDPVDTRWYSDIREDEEVSGWIKFGPIDEDTDKMILEIDYVINDRSQDRTTLKFKIEL